MLGQYGEGRFYSQSQKANFDVFLVGVHLRKYTCFMVFQICWCWNCISSFLNIWGAPWIFDERLAHVQDFLAFSTCGGITRGMSQFETCHVVAGDGVIFASVLGQWEPFFKETTTLERVQQNGRLWVCSPLQEHIRKYVIATHVYGYTYMTYVYDDCCWHTVDGRNPAPPWMVETLWIMG